MVFEKIAQPDSADDVARVVYSRRPAAEVARVNYSRHTCCCIYFSKTISPPHILARYTPARVKRDLPLNARLLMMTRQSNLFRDTGWKR